MHRRLVAAAHPAAAAASAASAATAAFAAAATKIKNKGGREGIRRWASFLDKCDRWLDFAVVFYSMYFRFRRVQPNY